MVAHFHAHDLQVVIECLLDKYVVCLVVEYRRQHGGEEAYEC